MTRLASPYTLGYGLYGPVSCISLDDAERIDPGVLEAKVNGQLDGVLKRPCQISHRQPFHLLVKEVCSGCLWHFLGLVWAAPTVAQGFVSIASFRLRRDKEDSATRDIVVNDSQ